MTTSDEASCTRQRRDYHHPGMASATPPAGPGGTTKATSPSGAKTKRPHLRLCEACRSIASNFSGEQNPRAYQDCSGKGGAIRFRFLHAVAAHTTLLRSPPGTPRNPQKATPTQNTCSVTAPAAHKAKSKTPPPALLPHRAPDAFPALLRDALGDCDGADPPRLRADYLATGADDGIIEQELRHLGGLPAPGFAGYQARLRQKKKQDKKTKTGVFSSAGL